MSNSSSEFISKNQLIDSKTAGRKNIILANPLQHNYQGLGMKGDQLPGPGGKPITGNDCVLSCCDGNFEVRESGADGECEQWEISGNLAVRRKNDVSYVVPFA